MDSQTLRVFQLVFAAPCTFAMKILFHSTSKREIENAKSLLESKGVPAFIGSENSGPALGFVIANKYTLWACLDGQYEDAIKVLNNPDHEVLEPVDPAEFQRFIENSKRQSANTFYNRFMLCLVLTIILAFGWAALNAIIKST